MSGIYALSVILTAIYGSIVFYGKDNLLLLIYDIINIIERNIL